MAGSPALVAGQTLTSDSLARALPQPPHLLVVKTSHTPCVTSPLSAPFIDGEAEGMGGREHRAESVAELGPGPGGML